MGDIVLLVQDFVDFNSELDVLIGAIALLYIPSWLLLLLLLLLLVVLLDVLLIEVMESEDKTLPEETSHSLRKRDDDEVGRNGGLSLERGVILGFKSTIRRILFQNLES